MEKVNEIFFYYKGQWNDVVVSLPVSFPLAVCPCACVYVGGVVVSLVVCNAISITIVKDYLVYCIYQKSYE